jgi:hypothetical protein
MTELTEKLKQLPTFQVLNDVEADLKAVETPRNFNPDDPEHIAQQWERLRVREGLDRGAAMAAFRLEVVESTDSLLSLHERLAVTAAYDPVVQQLHIDNDRHVRNRQRNKAPRAVSSEGQGVPTPVHNVENLSKKITESRIFAESYGGEAVGIRLHHNMAITGTLPSVETSFALSEPSIQDDSVEYHIPSAFSGVSSLVFFDGSKGSGVSSIQLDTTDVTRNPGLFEVVDGELVANPQLSRLRQELGLLGVNIYRDFYLDDFTKSIIPEPEGWMRIMPEPERVRIPRRRDPHTEVRFR